MKIYAGTSGYSYKEWKGKFYPEKISPKEMLRYYSRRLNSVEINSTFYHMPVEDVLSAWATQVPDNFLFALKAPQIITHMKRLRNAEEETEYLFRTLATLEQRLGPVLFQFPGSFRADKQALEDFLRLIPDSIHCAFEFRSPSWLVAEILELLQNKGCSLCIADTSENAADKIISTASWGYLRLRRPDYKDGDLAEWLEKISSQKWEKVFVFFKHEEGAVGADMAMRFLMLADSGGKRPKKTKQVDRPKGEGY